jgi:hypothetical protein
MGRFVKQCAREFVSAPADAILYFCFTRLISPWSEAQIGADIARSSEASRSIHGLAEGERRQRPDARHRHQLPADGFNSNGLKNTAYQPFKLAVHGGNDGQQGLCNIRQRRVGLSEFAHARGEQIAP